MTETTELIFARNVIALQEAYKTKYVGAFEISQRWEEICLQAKEIVDGND